MVSISDLILVFQSQNYSKDFLNLCCITQSGFHLHCGLPIMLGVSWEMLSTLSSYLKLQGLVFSQSLNKHITSASLG